MRSCMVWNINMNGFVLIGISYANRCTYTNISFRILFPPAHIECPPFPMMGGTFRFLSVLEKEVFYIHLKYLVSNKPSKRFSDGYIRRCKLSVHEQ